MLGGKGLTLRISRTFLLSLRHESLSLLRIISATLLELCFAELFRLRGSDEIDLLIAEYLTLFLRGQKMPILQ